MLEPSNAPVGLFCTCRATVPGLLNKISCSALALGVTKFANIRYVILVTLCFATYVRLGTRLGHLRVPAPMLK